MKIIKVKWRRIISMLSAFVIAFSSMIVPVNAATINDGGYTGFLYADMPFGGIYNYEENYYKSYNGVSAYCIEPERVIEYESDTYSEQALSDYKGLSSEKKIRIAAISAFGYGYGTRNDYGWYVATQKAIWQEIDSRYANISVHACAQNSYDRSDATNVTSIINQEIQSILDDVNNYERKTDTPNFTIKDSKGNIVGSTGYDITIPDGVLGETYTITNSNGSLEAMKVLTNTFAIASINGDKITVTLTKDDLNQNHNIVLSKNYNYVLPVLERPIVLVSGDSADPKQNVIVFTRADPPTGRVLINASGHSVVAVTKADATTKTPQGDVVNFAGTQYELKDTDTNKSFGVVTVNENGGSDQIEKLEPGNYSLTETKPAVGMKLNPTPRQFTLDGINEYVFDETDEVIRGGFSVQKRDTETGTTPQGDAKNLKVTFDLYNRSKNPVFVNGKTYGVNAKIATYTTDSTGYFKSSSDLLPYGTYEIIETASPDHYTGNVSGNTISSTFSVREDNVNVVTSGFSNEIERSGFTIQKEDAVLGTTPQANANLQTIFDLYNRSENAVVVEGNTYEPNKKIGTYTTDQNGHFSSDDHYLPYGSYEAIEVVSPEFYTGDEVTENVMSSKFTVRMNSTTVTAPSFVNKVQYGGFSIQKEDSETSTIPQGNAQLGSLTFDLYNISNHPVVVEGKTIAPNEKISTFVTDQNGYYASAKNYLPVSGTYRIVETKAPTGYTGSEEKENTVIVEFTVKAENEISTAPVLKNRVDYGKFSIHKTYADTVGPSFSTNEEGAEFTALLKSKVMDMNGDGEISIEEARAQATDVSNFTKHEYSVFTTDSMGMGTSCDLAYGEYIVFQTATSNPEIDMIEQIARFEVRADGQPTKEYQATNTSVPYWLNLQKVDHQTNTPISYNSAEFKVFQLTDVHGNEVNQYVKQKVNDRWYDVFRTYSSNASNDKIANGTFVASTATDDLTSSATVTLPLALSAGTYRIEEVKSPLNFTIMKPKEFTIANANISLVDEDGENVISVVARDKQITGSITVNKSLIDFSSDQSFIDRNDLSGFGFTLKAAETIYNVDNGTVLMYEGDIAKNIYGNVVGEFHVDANGNGTVDELPLGKYILSETSQPDGTVTNNKTYELEVKQKETSILGFINRQPNTNEDDYDLDENGNPYVSVVQEIENDTTKVSISKTDVTGDKELAGATLTVTDLDGNEVDTWISTDQKHIIEGLKANQTYTLTEVIAPNDYVKASSVNFTIEDNGEVKPVAMIDKQVVISKIDVGGEEVVGAGLTVKDKEGNIIDQWTSNGEEHKVNGLVEGETYILSETVVADGYVKATDIEFTVDGDKNTQHIDMTDKYVSVSKIDMGGKEIIGAEMQVTDSEGNVIDTWISDGTEHRIPGLEENKSYTLSETITPEGYVKVTDIPFTVSGADQNGIKVDQHIYVTDKIVSINKTDGEGNEVEGASITVTDKDGNVVDSWISTDQPHNVIGLEEGQDYTWHEDYSEDIFGYYYAEDYTFTVTADGINQNLEMIDAPIRYAIAKVDDNGNYVADVVLKLKDITDAENPVDIELPNEGKTTDQPFELDKVLLAEHTYSLTEEEYVAGVYKVADAVEFTVPKYGTSKTTTITMVDETTNIAVRKVDEDGNPLAGAKMEIYEANKNDSGKYEKGELVYSFTSTDDVKGTDISSYVKGDETYYLTESEAPFGFNTITDQLFTVTGKKETPQTVIAIDTAKTIYVSVKKVDSADHNHVLSGAEFKLYNHSNGSEAALVDGKNATKVTDQNGICLFAVKYNPNETYYVQETKAPEGYELNDTKYDVTLSKDYSFAKNKPIEIIVEDTLIPVVLDVPKTGDSSISWPYCLSMLFGFMGLMYCGIYLYKEKKK